MKLINSIIFNGFFVLGTFFMGLFCLPVLPSKKLTKEVSIIWANFSIFILKKIIKVKIELRGFDKIPKKGALIAANHQSAFETIFFINIFKNPVYVLKKQLLYIPFYGWYISRLQHIAIDRKEKIRALKSISTKAVKLIKEDSKLIIFPEGTRMPYNKLGKLKSGIFSIQKETKLPVYPIALVSGHVWGKNSFYKNSGTIVLEVLKPIPYGLEKKVFMQRLSESLEKVIFKINLEN